ncbi:MAG: hypothetical protein PVH25_14920 [Burkholderiales bacterium]|jgi:hypothetical protein
MTQPRFKQHACKMYRLPARFADATLVWDDGLVSDVRTSDRLLVVRTRETCNQLERGVLRARAKI